MKHGETLTFIYDEDGEVIGYATDLRKTEEGFVAKDLKVGDLKEENELKLETTYKIHQYVSHGLGIPSAWEHRTVATIEVIVDLVNNMGNVEDTYTVEPTDIITGNPNSDSNKYLPMESSSETLKELIDNVEKSAKTHFEEKQKWNKTKDNIMNEIGFSGCKVTNYTEYHNSK